MAKAYILYNPNAGSGEYREDVDALEAFLDDDVQRLNITQITNYAVFLQNLEKDDYLVIAGGDGTLNRFINDTAGLRIAQEIYYFPIGTGNDFAHDLKKTQGDKPFPIKQYLENLPTVEVNGKRYRFLNGVGYGIDGYCCKIGDEQRKTSAKKVNYTTIAIQGLLFHYKPTRATVTVDGVTRTYEKVWLAPTMHGRFYGGGMMPTPGQDRTAQTPMLSTMVFHGASSLHTLMVFPSIFQGEHVKHTKIVDILQGSEITVEFDRPTPLQIDGETILGVTSYTARSAACRSASKKVLTV